ncbi:MAG TPA: GNAT family N-acetyltransferase [Candidatus Acidoferrales bacterium]|nr:GNAT family N-acetyltransferase [Candidatus Acidoferrales bacterium]
MSAGRTKRADATPRRVTAPLRAAARWRIEPLTPGRWDDFVTLFGPKGACAGCWCTWARMPAAEWRERGPGGRRAAMRRLVHAGGTPGLIAYGGATPVGWIAVGPRAHFRRYESSRLLAPVDERAVWSAPCFFVARTHRGRGLTVALLEAAARWAAKHGAPCLEGYPVDTRGGRQAAVFVWTGLPQTFLAARFHEVARRSPARPIMRRELRAPARRG